MEHQMFQRINITHWLTSFVKECIIRCEKVRNACYSILVDGNHNNNYFSVFSVISQLLSKYLIVIACKKSWPRTRLFFVLEAPRDQDLGLEDYISAASYIHCYRTEFQHILLVYYRAYTCTLHPVYHPSTWGESLYMTRIGYRVVRLFYKESHKKCRNLQWQIKTAANSCA